MARLHPGWLVVLCATVLLVSSWLPWLTTTAGNGAHATGIGSKVGNIGVPPEGFGVGQLIVLLSSTLIVAAAMAARSLYPRITSTAALSISVFLTVMVAWYYHLYVAKPIAAGLGLWIGGSAMIVAVVLSILTMVVGWAQASRRR
jgi:hypothetical protein